MTVILLLVDLLGLLKWRSQKDKLSDILPALMKVSGEEIVKVLYIVTQHRYINLNKLFDCSMCKITY